MWLSTRVFCGVWQRCIHSALQQVLCECVKRSVFVFAVIGKGYVSEISGIRRLLVQIICMIDSMVTKRDNKIEKKSLDFCRNGSGKL